jgi:hypothetical protein
LNADKSKLRNLAAVAEVISAVAVVLSLIYVGVGLRQNTSAIEGRTYQDVVRASNEYLLAVATDPALAETIARSWSDRSQLSQIERVQLFYLERVFWRNMENAYLQHERGILGEQEWGAYSRLVCEQKNEVTWDGHVPTLSAVFVEFVESCPK